jgi:hypothetical protein
MSDRTPGSVRTGSPAGDAKGTAAPSEPTPVQATQTIPGAKTSRAKGPATGATSTKSAKGAKGAAAPAAPTTDSAPAAPPASAAPATGTTAPATGTTAPATGTTAPATGTTAPATGTTAPATGTTAPATGTTAAAPAPGADAPAAVGSAPGGDPTAAAKAPKGRAPGRLSGRGPRRARLQLRHIDTWSALKISLVLSIALFFIWMVAVGVLYGVLSALGVFDTLNELFGQLGSASGSDSGGGDVVTPGVVFGGAAVIGAINIVLLTALCTVGTFIYNLCSDLVGGLELTLSERD